MICRKFTSAYTLCPFMGVGPGLISYRYSDMSGYTIPRLGWAVSTVGHSYVI